MPETNHLLGTWANFYVITGSSSAALIGLMFVVVTLIAGRPRRDASSAEQGLSTFSTPTVVHFGAALLISAVMSAPWASLAHAAFAIGAAGTAGVLYLVFIAHRTSRLTAYSPGADDWFFYTVAPLVAYVCLLGGAILTHGAASAGLFVIAAAVIALIFIGVHNSWDVVTYIATGRADED